MNSLSISSSATPTTAPAIAEQQKYAALLAELATGHCSRSYWARKARMRALEAELSSLDYKLLEFDIAFNFHDAVDLARSAENIFQADKSNEKVRQRIDQLFSALLNDTSNQDNQNDSNSQNFSTELVSQLSMERLQEMFFFAFPEQRNSTRGSLQVYLTLASNRPQTLGSIATKLFAYYLGASAEFQRGQKQPTTNKAAADMQSIITPMDAVLFFLFDSLVQANFGDLSVHNIGQVFQILLHNCFADSLGRVPDNFYSQSGIPCLAHIRRPALSWHFCLQVLAQLYRKRGLDQLANMLLPESSASADGEKEIIEDLSSTLERSLADPELGPQLLQSVGFVRLALRWAMAGPLGKRQTDLRNQLVWVPANVFWVDPSGLDHYWVYNMDAEEEDSPAEIEEPQQGEKSLGIEPGLLHPIRLLNTLFSIPGAVAEQELAQLAMSNAQSVVLLALMATENWKRAAELLKQFDIPMPDASSQQQLILQLQRVQALIALRKLAAAFPTCHQLLANFSEDEKTRTENTEQKMEEELPEFPALIVAQDASWVHLEQRVHLRLYLQLLLFHLFWLGFAKCQKSGGVRAKKGTELMFLALMLVAQSCWEHFGFGLFEQLVDHVASKEHFRCPGLLNWLNNQMLLGQLLGMDHVLMDFSATPADSGSFSTPAQICQAILQGKARMCAEPSAMVILSNFLNEFQHQIVEVLQMLL